MMRAKKGCIGMKTNRWITSWHVVWFLISRWQPTVFWPMGDDDFLRWTSGAFFYKRESIFWAESICPPPAFVPLWVINENEEAIRSEEPLISLDLLWIRNLWPCVIYILYHPCHVLLTQFSTQRNTIAHFLWGIVMLRLSRKSATICVFLDQVQAFNPTFCEQPIKLQTKSYKDCKREEQRYTTHLDDDKVKTSSP